MRPASQSRAAATPWAMRECQVAKIDSPCAAAMSRRTCTSDWVAPGGFSSIRWRPARSTATAAAKRGTGGRHRLIAQISGWASSIVSMS